MTRPAPITKADLSRYPHLGYSIQAAEAPAPAPAPAPAVPPAERAAIVIPVPSLAGLLDPDRMEVGMYGFVAGVIFMGLLEVIRRMM